MSTEFPGLFPVTSSARRNYLMSGHWSEKARNEAQLFGEVKEVAVDPKGGNRCRGNVYTLKYFKYL
jgi:phosphoserine aminotransferase